MTDRTFTFIHPNPDRGPHDVAVGPDCTDITVNEWDSVLTAIIAPNGEQVGIEFMPDGSMKFGTWNADGEWIELSFIRTPPDNFQHPVVKGVDLAAGPPIQHL